MWWRQILCITVLAPICRLHLQVLSVNLPSKKHPMEKWKMWSRKFWWKPSVINFFHPRWFHPWCFPSALPRAVGALPPCSSAWRGWWRCAWFLEELGLQPLVPWFTSSSRWIPCWTPGISREWWWTWGSWWLWWLWWLGPISHVYKGTYQLSVRRKQTLNRFYDRDNSSFDTSRWWQRVKNWRDNFHGSSLIWGDNRDFGHDVIWLNSLRIGGSVWFGYPLPMLNYQIHPQILDVPEFSRTRLAMLDS